MGKTKCMQIFSLSIYFTVSQIESSTSATAHNSGIRVRSKNRRKKKKNVNHSQWYILFEHWEHFAKRLWATRTAVRHFLPFTMICMHPNKKKKISTAEKQKSNCSRLQNCAGHTRGNRNVDTAVVSGQVRQTNYARHLHCARNQSLF